MTTSNSRVAKFRQRKEILNRRVGETMDMVVGFLKDKILVKIYKDLDMMVWFYQSNNISYILETKIPNVESFLTKVLISAKPSISAWVRGVASVIPFRLHWAAASSLFNLFTW